MLISHSTRGHSLLHKTFSVIILSLLSHQIAQANAQDRAHGAFDYAWLWSLKGVDQAGYSASLSIPSALSFDYLEQLGGQLAALRRSGALHLPQGMWREQHLVDGINYLNSATSDAIIELASEFQKQGLVAYQGQFLTKLLAHFEHYFRLDMTTQTLSDEQQVLQLWQSVHWPSLWFNEQLFADQQALALATLRSKQWQELLANEALVWAEFFADMLGGSVLGIAALIIERWLYDEMSPWPLDSRPIALRSLYALASSMYEVIELNISEHFTRLDSAASAYILAHPQQKEPIERYVALVRSNTKALLSIFYDVNEQSSYIKNRNRLLFNNNATKIAHHKEQVQAVYQWLWASAQQRQAAYQEYWQAYD